MTCNQMSNTVAATGRLRSRAQSAATSGSLYASNGGRKYLNLAERQRALMVMAALEPDQALFALTLAWSGARVSEVLALTPASFQIECGVVALRTLKQRRHVMREVPIPPELMNDLDRHFGLATAQRNPEAAATRLWPRHRVTGWRIIKGVMMLSQIVGRGACPRGLRHSFGVGTVQAGIPLNLTQRWMGHSRLSTTAIYNSVCGPEEIAFAAQFWRASTLPAAHAPQEM